MEDDREQHIHEKHKESLAAKAMSKKLIIFCKRNHWR
jgi:hypothetical protein